MPDVVSDIFLSESPLPADVVRPSAAWAESEGVIANSDARVFKINNAVDAVDHGVVGRLADISRPIVVTGRDVREPPPLPRIRMRGGPGATHLPPAALHDMLVSDDVVTYRSPTGGPRLAQVTVGGPSPYTDITASRTH